MTTTPLSDLPLRPGSFADRALKLIREQPGLSLTELHAILRPGVPSMSGTSRDVDRLGGRVEKRRDAQCVRHYPVKQP